MQFLHAVNHVLDTNLMKPLGRRTKGVLFAILTVAVLAQTPLFAQSQTDCVGQYEDAIQGYWNQMWRDIADINNNYNWFNPLRAILVTAEEVEYYAQAESAFAQLLKCSTWK